ncbi:hypothetical protein [Rufibacter roseus]|uniref:Uncharacterized protein n=1 Tax=Rufibacter roseus TaxID=1567108 RepID=A0ABW2DF01_9BACT|nr:hypothetical protein [Rufibacter roseus]
MKDSFYILLTALLIFGSCQQKSKNTEQGTQAPAQVRQEEQSILHPLLAEYGQFLTRLDSGKVENMSVAAEKYKELFKGQNTSLADSGYVLFEKFYNRVDNTINENYNEEKYDSLVIHQGLSKSLQKSKELRTYDRHLNKNGFKLAMTEGITYLKQDRNFVKKHFYTFLSPVLKVYLSKLNKENIEGFADDASLTIAPRQLADRVIWWEDFVKANPEFILVEEAKENVQDYLTTLLVGMDNTPVLEHGDNRLNSYYAEAYHYLLKERPNSKAAKAVKPYFQALQNADTLRANVLLKQYQELGIID